MTNKPKAIGTAAETAVRNYLLSCGFSALEAHRNVLKGSADEGDVWLRHPDGLIVFEVKAGKAAKEASPGKIQGWMNETAVETLNAGARMGVLVTQRAGVGYPRAGEWWAHVYDNDFASLRYEGWSDFIRESTQEGRYSPVIARVMLKDVVACLAQ